MQLAKLKETDFIHFFESANIIQVEKYKNCTARKKKKQKEIEYKSAAYRPNTINHHPKEKKHHTKNQRR